MKKHCFKLANARQFLFALILSFTYCSVDGQNLCERYGDTNTDIIILQGANSSQFPNIDGLKVKVLGDFIITESRTFTDVIFEFGTNGRILGGIDNLHFVNCKLYSCTDSWKGIVFDAIVSSTIVNKYFQFRDCDLESYIQIVTTNANFSAGRTNFYSNNYTGAEAANLHVKTTISSDLSNTAYFICNFYSSGFDWVKVTGPAINTALPGVSFTTCTFIDLGSNAIVSENCDFNV